MASKKGVKTTDKLDVAIAGCETLEAQFGDAGITANNTIPPAGDSPMGVGATNTTANADPAKAPKPAKESKPEAKVEAKEPAKATEAPALSERDQAILKALAEGQAKAAVRESLKVSASDCRGAGATEVWWSPEAARIAGVIAPAPLQDS